MRNRRKMLLLLAKKKSGGEAVTVSGVSPLSLVNALAHSIKHLTQYGKLSVSGSTITCNNGELKVVNNEIVADGTPEEIVLQGKNLLSYEGEAVPYNHLGVSITRNENVYKVSVSDDATGYPYVRICTLHGIKSGTYTIKTYGTDGQSTLGARIVNRQVSPVVTVGQEGTFTVSADVTDDLDAEICLTSSSVAAGDYYLTVQFEKGSTATEYQPPHHETATAENLFAVDNIVDEQDIITGKVIRRTESVVSDGTTPSGRYVGEVGVGNIIVKARETGYSGEVVSFTTEEETPLTGLRVNFEPQQDLHGYNNPWPAGGGKNKLSLPDETFTQYQEYTIDPVVAGDYVYSGVVSSTDTDTNRCAMIFIDENGTSVGSIPIMRSVGNERVSGTVTLTGTAVKLRLYASSGFAQGEGDTASFKDNMLCLSTASNPTVFAPYSNECPIYGHTDADVVRTGKNLLDPTTKRFTGTNMYFYETNGLYLKEGTYTLSFKGESIISGLYAMKWPFGSGSLAVKYNAKELTFTLTEAQKVLLNFYDVNNQVTDDVSMYQLELGSTATAYEPYVGTTYPIPLGTTVYGGYVDVVTGEVWATYAGAEYDGSVDENIDVATTGLRQTFRLWGLERNSAYTSYLANELLINNSNENSAQYENTITGRGTAYVYDVFYVYMPLSIASTLQEFKDWLAENPLQLVFPLPAPVLVTTLTPTQVELLQGENNIWGNGKSVNVYVSDGELIVQVTPQKLKTAEGTNVVEVTSNVDPVELDISYKARRT